MKFEHNKSLLQTRIDNNIVWIIEQGIQGVAVNLAYK